MVLKRLLYGFILSLLFITLSCRKDNKVLEKEDLFIIPMGVMADELEYFYRDSSLLPGSSDLYLRDGRIYVTSSHAGKIMEMNSYGDLLSLIYNPKTNPEPAQYIKSQNGEKEETLIRIQRWNFRQIEHVAVSSRGKYIVDRVEDSVAHTENGVLYNRIILFFDETDSYRDYLGQEGLGGTPFPYIQDLLITANDEIVVISQSSESYQIYWFSPEGKLMYKVLIDLASLPEMEDPGWSGGQVETIYPDPDSDRLYLKIDYFPLNDSVDRQSASRLYTLNLQTGEYDGHFDIPSFEILMGDQEIEGVNSYLGAVSGGLHYFLGADFNGQYHLTVMNSEGAVKVTRVLNIQDQDIIYKSLYLSPEGLLSGIFYEDKGARISWWRSDALAEKYAENQ